MKTSAYHTTNEVYPVAALICAILVAAVLGGAGVLALRHQISTTARHTQEMQRSISEIERRLNYLDTKIAEVNQPAYLRHRAAELGMVMEPPARNQVVRLRERRVDDGAVAAREDRAGRRERSEPFMQTFDLAVMEPLRRLD
ncbi:MAG: hypothetical protein JJU00_01825 [Opitutales bacterium]|nr:hypothetical protein [Opitutales bacterium]